MTDTDRELLEFVAKAAGYRVRWVDAPTSFNYEGFLIKTEKKLPNECDVEIKWNPFTNSGDALELAVKLGIGVAIPDKKFPTVRRAFCSDIGGWSVTDPDVYAAQRRAIVLAAAEIGRTMDEIQRTKENR